MNAMCGNCNKRIQKRPVGRWGNLHWFHVATGASECAGLMCKYASPKPDVSGEADRG